MFWKVSKDDHVRKLKGTKASAYERFESGPTIFVYCTQCYPVIYTWECFEDLISCPFSHMTTSLLFAKYTCFQRNINPRDCTKKLLGKFYLPWIGKRHLAPHCFEGSRMSLNSPNNNHGWLIRLLKLRNKPITGHAQT